MKKNVKHKENNCAVCDELIIINEGVDSKAGDKHDYTGACYGII